MFLEQTLKAASFRDEGKQPRAGQAPDVDRKLVTPSRDVAATSQHAASGRLPLAVLFESVYTDPRCLLQKVWGSGLPAATLFRSTPPTRCIVSGEGAHEAKTSTESR